MKLYVKSTFNLADCFGNSERQDIGEDIILLFSGKIISKRMRDNNTPYGLKAVADAISNKFCSIYEHIECNVDIYYVLRALEGMCYHNEACEVADGFYYVGSYEQWNTDNEAHQELEELIQL